MNRHFQRKPPPKLTAKIYEVAASIRIQTAGKKNRAQAAENKKVVQPVQYQIYFFVIICPYIIETANMNVVTKKTDRVEKKIDGPEKEYTTTKTIKYHKPPIKKNITIHQPKTANMKT